MNHNCFHWIEMDMPRGHRILEWFPLIYVDNSTFGNSFPPPKYSSFAFLRIIAAFYNIVVSSLITVGTHGGTTSEKYTEYVFYFIALSVCNLVWFVGSGYEQPFWYYVVENLLLCSEDMKSIILFALFSCIFCSWPIMYCSQYTSTYIF